MKGATPIVGVILLLLITIAAAGSTYLWLSRTQTSLLSQTSTGITESQKNVYGKLKIVSVWNESTKLCMLLRNLSEQDITYKSSDLKKMAIMVDNVPYDFNTTTLHDIDQGEVVTVCLCSSTGTGCAGTYGIYTYQGDTITVKVEPPFGTGDTYEYVYTG